MKHLSSDSPPFPFRLDSLLHRRRHAPGAEDQPYLNQPIIFLNSSELDPQRASGSGSRVRFPATESRLATRKPAHPLFAYARMKFYRKVLAVTAHTTS